jgi:SAM-dependent methyltransferase
MMTSRARHSDNFYEQLAPLYHLKVDWDKRLPKETALFDLLFANSDISAVCDLGCGDGGHAQEIVKRGAVYVGIDSSALMIRMAKAKHARRKGIRFLKGDMLQLPVKYNGMFDLVLLLGNTLPHILSGADLKMLIKNVSRLLPPHGRFVIQTVNPDMLKTKQVHFLPPKLADNRVLFAPFYARQDEYWSFLMPIYIIEQGKIISHSTLETRLKFWLRSEIAAAASHDFKVTHTFGDAGLAPYHRPKSENMILIMEKV